MARAQGLKMIVKCGRVVGKRHSDFGGDVMLKSLLFVLVTIFVACAGDKGADEPVGTDDSNPAIPDMPGAAGEAADKPAGQGAADAPDAASKAATGNQQTTDGSQLYVASWVLNVRSGAGMAHPVTRTIPKGSVINVLERKAIWIRIGDNEWVSDKHLSNEPVN